MGVSLQKEKYKHSKLNFTLILSYELPTCKNDGSRGHEAMEVNGGVKGDVSVEEGLSAQRDEVATHGEEHVGKQKGDGGRRATGDDDSHHWRLRDTCRFCLQTVVWTQGL